MAKGIRVRRKGRINRLELPGFDPVYIAYDTEIILFTGYRNAYPLTERMEPLPDTGTGC